MLLVLITLISVLQPASAQTREDRWRQDIQTIQGEIVRRHPNPFTKVSREEWQRAFQALGEVVGQRTDYQLTAELARIVAMIGDEHTTLPATQGARLLPLRVRWFSDGLYVVAAPEANGRILGKKIVRIAGKPVEEVFRALLPYIAHEVEGWARLNSLNLLISPDALQAAGVIEAVGPVTYDFEEFSSTIALANLGLVAAPYLARPKNPVSRRNLTQVYWFEYLADSKTLYIQYNQCRETPLLPMAQFAAEVAEVATTNPVDRLIIDLRNNTGGNSSVINPLLEAFEQAFLAGKLFPKSGFYTLIGRQTFSSATLNAHTFRQNGSMLVGEPTGGVPGGFGEVVAGQLANSGLQYQVSTRDFSAVFPPGPLRPAVEVEMTGAEYLADRDPVFEKAVELAIPLVIPGLTGRRGIVPSPLRVDAIQ